MNESNTNFMDMSLKSKRKEFMDVNDGSEENSDFNDNYSQNINLPEKKEEEINKKIDITKDLDTSFKEEKSMNDFKI